MKQYRRTPEEAARRIVRMVYGSVVVAGETYKFCPTDTIKVRSEIRKVVADAIRDDRKYEESLREVGIPRKRKCRDCCGRGWSEAKDDTCVWCNGSGFRADREHEEKK